jgi:periplasmic copper chaperone A
MHRKIVLAGATLALAVPSAAQAHVTLQPKEAAAGGFTVENVRVPNERDDAATTKVDLQLPPGFAFASYSPQPGWSVRIVKEKLDKPIQTDDGPITEEIRRMVWTGTGKGEGRIGPGQFKDFPLSVQIPDKAGSTLTFKALQTYSNGEVVRWIGAPDADKPAPTVKITAAAGEEEEAQPASAPTQPAAAADTSDKASKGLGIAALIVGGLGLLVGIGAFVTSRR